MSHKCLVAEQGWIVKSAQAGTPGLQTCRQLIQGPQVHLGADREEAQNTKGEDRGDTSIRAQETPKGAAMAMAWERGGLGR